MFVFKDRWSLPSKIIGLLCCHKAKKELLTKEASFKFKIKKHSGNAPQQQGTLIIQERACLPAQYLSTAGIWEGQEDVRLCGSRSMFPC